MTMTMTIPKSMLGNMVAVVTGASSGVGRAIARAFATEGARVALLARGQDGLRAGAQDVRRRGAEALELPVDVSDAAAVDRAAATVADRWGRIDLWVNNAMLSVFAPADQITPDEYRRVTEVNYLGYVNGTLAALKRMRPLDRGAILQIGSALAYRSIPLQAAYCASKAAIRAFTDSLRCELLHDGSNIRLCQLHLPAVNTPQFEVVRNRLPGHPQPVPPIYQPEVIARAAVAAALHPRREIWIGWSTTAAIVGQRLVPGALDRYLARHAWRAQSTTSLPSHPATHQADNIDGPLPGDRGVHGPFDATARRWSSQLWVRSKLWPLLAGTASLAVLYTLARKATWLRLRAPAGP
jgi:NAD(P)-dependent dehydrogenase (short-subunit alcohol dehydrogenase family)